MNDDEGFCTQFEEELVPREGLESINDLAYCEVLWSEVFYSNLY